MGSWLGRTLLRLSRTGALGLGMVVCGLAAAGPSGPAAAQAQKDDINTLDQRLRQLYNAGRYSDAQAVAERLIDLIGKRSGTSNVKYADALKNMAIVYWAEDRFADAEPLALRALAIREKVLGPEHLDVAADLSDLAHHYLRRGRLSDAEPLDLRALAIKEKALGPDHK